MKKPTTSDIARLAGTSRATVSYVLNNVKNKSISKETCDRVMNAVKQLDYRPNFFAKGLKTRLSKTVAIILPSLTDPTIPIMVKGLESAANQSGYSLMIHDNEQIGTSKLDIIEMICERAIDGIIYAYPNDSDDRALVEHIVNKRNIPTVVVGKKYEQINASSVRYDSYNMGQILGNYLKEAGHLKIALIMSGEITSTKKARIDGLKSSLGEIDIQFDCIIGKKEPFDPLKFYDVREYEAGFTTTFDFIQQHREHTAFIGMNSLIAAGVTNALKSCGISVPEQVCVSSFGRSLVSEALEPKPTVVDIPFYDIGKVAFEILEKTIVNKATETIQDVVFKPKLLVRHSCIR